MREVVAETIDRMHADFAHSIPRGVTIGQMLEAWVQTLNRNGVPPLEVPRMYDLACDNRTRRGIGSFMPASFDIVAEWLKIAEDDRREREYERNRDENRRAAAERDALPPVHSDKFAEQLERGRQIQLAKRVKAA